MPDGAGSDDAGLDEPVSARLAVTARTHGKVNLSLHVGPVGPDGYHPLRTIFQSLSLREEVTASELVTAGPPAVPPTVPATATSGPVQVSVTGVDALRVPTDASNLVVRAAHALAGRLGRTPNVGLVIVKAVPVAGGMAGGSADAAAALVALDALWGSALSRAELLAIASGLGADVPFTLLGGTAEGQGRGDALTPLPVRGEYHWVLAVRDEGLSTAEIYRRFDETAVPSSLHAELDSELRAGLLAGDAARVGAGLHNDLGAVALMAVPALGRTIAAAHEAGALGAVVSGSGPTIAVLARDAPHARQLRLALAEAGTSDRQLLAVGPASGAEIITSLA